MNGETIIIPNMEEFERKSQILIKGGAKNLHIATDFDKTLSKAWDKNKKNHTIIAQIREGKYLSDEYTKKSYELFDKYHPIEIDPKIPLAEKKRKMHEWWDIHIKFIAESGMNRKIANDIAKNKIILREGARDFFLELKRKKVPVLILSAALGDIIEKVLDINKMNSKDVHIISNFFKFDAKGNVKGYKSKIVHSLNKNEFEIKDTAFSKKIRERKNILLLGDTLDDLEMVKGAKCSTVLKIGFLNENVEQNLDAYKKAFDVIILNDGSMKFVNQLIKEIK